MFFSSPGQKVKAVREEGLNMAWMLGHSPAAPAGWMPASIVAIKASMIHEDQRATKENRIEIGYRGKKINKSA